MIQNDRAKRSLDSEQGHVNLDTVRATYLIIRVALARKIHAPKGSLSRAVMAAHGVADTV